MHSLFCNIVGGSVFIISGLLCAFFTGQSPHPEYPVRTNRAEHRETVARPLDFRAQYPLIQCTAKTPATGISDSPDPDGLAYTPSPFPDRCSVCRGSCASRHSTGQATSPSTISALPKIAMR